MWLLAHCNKYNVPERIISWLLMNTLFSGFICSSDLKLRQSVEESRGQENDQPSGTCRYSNGLHEAPEQQQQQQHKPSLEETVDMLLKRLREKRQALGLPDNMKVRPSVATCCLHRRRVYRPEKHKMINLYITLIIWNKKYPGDHTDVIL